jgi:hypothetical protein
VEVVSRLLECCIALGTEAVDDLVALLAAKADACGDRVQQSYVELALVLAAAWLDPSDPRIPTAVTRFVNDVERNRSNRPYAYYFGPTGYRSRACPILAPPTTAVPSLARRAALISDH